jgi:hypothetical protein
MISGKIRLLSAVISAAALLATPALADNTHKKKASGHDVHASRTQRGIYSWDGRYLGWDPDPNIRFQLMRDQNMPPD